MGAESPDYVKSAFQGGAELAPRVEIFTLITCLRAEGRQPGGIFSKVTGRLKVAAIASDELLALRRVFQKRHVHIHNNGIISERYVRSIPEDAALLGQSAPLSIEEFETAATALRRVIDQVVTARIR